MTCTRCEGLMVPDHLIDMQESGIPMWMKGWRCVSCGNIVDPLIQRHRFVQESGALHLLEAESSSVAFHRPVKVLV
ncbi:MAG TPA: hypothetical protein VJ746_10390 [Nitrospira sp.]|nr:hypothetical protein [Nitrospira sp.]